MTDLSLSDETKQFQELARDFSQSEIRPQAEHLDSTRQFPSELVGKAWEIGLVNTFVPEEYGGLALSILDSCVILEEIAAACPSVATVMAGNLVAAALVMNGGSSEQKSQYLSRLTGSPSFAGSLLLRGANGFSHPATYTKNGSHYSITASNAVALSCAQADFIVLLAAGEKGLSAFLLDGLPADTKIETFPRLGLRCADIQTITHLQTDVDESALLSGEGRADELLADAAAWSAPALAACAVGCARAALEHSIVYSKERQTFGKPISSYQAVSFMLADMARQAQAARLLTWRAATLADSKQRSDREAQLAWTIAVDAAMSSSCDAVQIFGGYGYSREYPVEKLMRDAKMLQILADTSFDVKQSIGRELLVAR